MKTLFVTDPAQLVQLSEELTNATHIALDTETVFRPELTVDGIPGDLRVISMAWRVGDGPVSTAVIDVRDVPSAAVAPVLAGLAVDGWNAAFDEDVLERAGLTVRSWWDAMIAESLLRLGTEGLSWYSSLDAAARTYLGRALDGKGGVQLSYDARSDLTAEQVAYAAADAEVTLALAAVLRDMVHTAGLDRVCAVEMAARPVIARMSRTGFPFDLDGWRARLDTTRARLDTATATLAALTDESELSWNPGSDAELRDRFNRFATAEVQARYGRLLEPSDKLDKQALRMIGGPFADAVLLWREHSKLLSTYGDNLEKFWRDGRIRPRYLQALVSTGRLASRDPNGQNLSPLMKQYIRPVEGRVFVHGDLSQAELRFLAQLSAEQQMRDAFASGEDFHTTMAALMFGVDMTALQSDNPDEFKRLRSRAKAMSFGEVYGMAAKALSTTLTAQGVPTTVDEARRLLGQLAEAMPTKATFLANRSQTVKDFAGQQHGADWDTTMRFAALRSETETLRRRLRKQAGSFPTGFELAAAWRGDPKKFPEAPTVDELESLGAELDAVYRFDAAVVIDGDGQPVEFSSRTPYGRRRRFQAPVDSSGNDKFSGVLTAAVLTVCLSTRPQAAGLVQAFAAEHGLTLPTPGRGDRIGNRVKVVKAFEGANRKLRWVLLDRVREQMGDHAWQWVLNSALSDVLRAQGNAYRNHPIQGGVADVVLEALADIGRNLPVNAAVVLSVHDSVVVECDEADALHVATLVRRAMEDAMARACPDVVVVADVDIRRSLDDHDVVELAAN